MEDGRARRARSDSGSLSVCVCVLNDIIEIISVERNYMELLYPVLLYNQ